MKLYYVSKEGVYMQGIYGIFDNFDLAKAAMADAIEDERDNYHEFFIYERELNTQGYDDISSTEGESK